MDVESWDNWVGDSLEQLMADGVAVASVGSYAGHEHLAPDR